MNRKAMAEQKIRRDEKLEALGRLASSVAHDFNNLLLVIAANAEAALIAGELAPRDELTEILDAAELARDLVRELLAFTRIEVYEPRLLQLNDVVEGARRTLERVLDGPVEICAELTSADTTVYADALQLERALLNLALRAHDAMPLGGRLTMATACEDDAVVLRVTDTGAHRHGSGLGLATVYGIVTRAEGSIAVAVAPVRGTTLTIRLPSAARAALPRAA
jgi:signal transduction histidine kinase